MLSTHCSCKRRGVRKEEEVRDDARRIEAKRLLDRPIEQAHERMTRQGLAVDVRHVGPEHERRLLAARHALQERRLPGRELHGVGSRIDDRPDRVLHVLDPAEERRFVEETMVDRDVEAATVGSEQAIQARGGRHAHEAVSRGGPGRGARRRTVRARRRPRH
jgi:hypothetical protein